MAYVVSPPGHHTERATTISRYPWHEWADGQWWQVVRGEDYTVTDDGFRSAIHNYARFKGLRAESHKNDDGIVLRFWPRA